MEKIVAVETYVESWNDITSRIKQLAPKTQRLEGGKNSDGNEFITKNGLSVAANLEMQNNTNELNMLYFIATNILTNPKVLLTIDEIEEMIIFAESVLTCKNGSLLEKGCLEKIDHIVVKYLNSSATKGASRIANFLAYLNEFSAHRRMLLERDYNKLIGKKIKLIEGIDDIIEQDEQKMLRLSNQLEDMIIRI